MEPNSSICFFFFFFFFLSLVQFGRCYTVQVNVTAGQGLIQKACQSSPYIDLCETSLRMDPNSGEADMEGLALIAVKVALANATETSQLITKMLNNSSLDHFLQQCLTDCVEQYWDSIDQLEDSLAAIAAKGFDDVEDWVKAAIADADTCEQGFKEKPGYESMLTSKNAVFKELCLNALSITSQLH